MQFHLGMYNLHVVIGFNIGGNNLKPYINHKTILYKPYIYTIDR